MIEALKKELYQNYSFYVGLAFLLTAAFTYVVNAFNFGIGFAVVGVLLILGHLYYKFVKK